MTTAIADDNYINEPNNTCIVTPFGSTTPFVGILKFEPNHTKIIYKLIKPEWNCRTCANRVIELSKIIDKNGSIFCPHDDKTLEQLKVYDYTKKYIYDNKKTLCWSLKIASFNSDLITQYSPEKKWPHYYIDSPPTFDKTITIIKE